MTRALPLLRLFTSVIEATFENGTHISVDALVGATDRPTACCFAATDRGLGIE